MTRIDTPGKAIAYWEMHIETAAHFNPEVECAVVLLLNTRRRIKGHHLLSIGTQDALLVHPREVFRTAIVGAASGIVLMHNHPSGEAQPSAADILLTRDLQRAGRLIQIELVDHIIVGRGQYRSLKQMGCLQSERGGEQLELSFERMLCP